MAVVYYGINVKFVKSNINKWINITGTPEFFSVRDDKLKNFTSKLLGKYDVVSVNDILNIHAEADFWVTYEDIKSAKAAGVYLLSKNVPWDKIHFLETDLEYRKNCSRLGTNLLYRSENIPMCTVGNRKHPFIKVSGEMPIQERVELWKDFSEKLINSNKYESPNKCLGCPLLVYGFYPKKVEVRKLRFLQDLAMDACNFKCIYCPSAQQGKFQKLKNTEGPTTYDVLREFSEIKEFVDMGEKFTVYFANGEPCANRYFDEIADILLSNKWRIHLFSNLSIYREKLAILMQEGRIDSIVTSIDAGTRHTFKKIKQNDRFDKVVENLDKYPVNKTKLVLKYLFLEGVNDNVEDIDGFYEIAKKVSATIELSTDKKTNAIPFTENPQLRDMTLRLIHKAKADGLKVVSDCNNINPKDVEFIKDGYAKA